jgi:hypothetical protein
MSAWERERQTLNNHVLLLLHTREHPCFRVVQHGCEVRIWEDHHRYAYEILSSGTVIARGTAATEFAALEGTIPPFQSA